MCITTTHEIIIHPTITEKSMSAIGFKKYTFGVTRDVAKTDIARAVEELFKVKAAKVNTLHVRGHLRRQGRTQGYAAAWEKAVVPLTEDSKPIEFFEGMM